jgi:hypothetical protein
MQSGVKLTALALFAVCLSGSARADTIPIDDPLHGHWLAGCISNGTNTPIIGPTNGASEDSLNIQAQSWDRGFKPIIVFL